MRPVQNMSSRQRKATPPMFATWLLWLVRRQFDVYQVATLWVAEDSVYKLLPNTDCWDEPRDANRYTGPCPIVAHPPCGPWGKLRWRSQESPSHGINAMALVHRYGGIVEHPVGSSLFREHGRVGALVLKVNQNDWGHPALKPTLLYLWGF